MPVADGPLGAALCGSPCNRRKKCPESRLRQLSPAGDTQEVRLRNAQGAGLWLG